jgi:hypothetical protein
MRTILSLILLALPVLAQDSAQAVQQVMEKQVAAWNHHDLEAFMRDTGILLT